mgnify:CR=1 FL=1
MTFKEFWLSMTMPERAEFASNVNSTVAYLDHISTGYRKASPSKLVPLIVEHSGGKVSREEIRPDIFGHFERAAA